MSDLKNFEKSQSLANCTSIEDVVALINGAECPERVAGQYAVEACLSDADCEAVTADFVRGHLNALSEHDADFDADVALKYALAFHAHQHAIDDTAQRAHDIITACADSVGGADTELTTILHALEDGAALAALGYTDDDQAAVEHAHSAVNRLLGLGLVKLTECVELIDTCYTVDDAFTKVEECLVIDLHRFIKDEYLCDTEEVASVDTDEDGNEVEVTRWAVLRWKTGQVNRAETVGTFDDEEEAREALSEARKEVAEWYAMDIYNNPQNAPFSTREQAEDFVAQESE